MSSTNYGPCAACKLLRRKCTPECVFAPYFPPDQHQKFANVHKVFGASNVAKLLNELKIDQREDAVISLSFEAEARLRDPIYGCIGVISILQHRLKRVHQDLYIAKNELANYIGPSAMFPMLQPPGFIQPHANNPTSPAIFPYNMQAPMLGLPAGQPPGAAQLVIQDQHHRQMLEAQQLAGVAAAREHQEMFRSYEQQSDQLLRFAAGRGQQEMLRSYEQQQAQQSDQLVRLAATTEQQEMFMGYEQQPQQSDQLVRLNAGFDTAGQVTASGFNQMALGGLTISPSLALGSYDNPYQNQQLPQDHAHQIQPQDHSHHHHQIQQQDHFYHHHQIQLQLLLEQQHLAQQQQQKNQPLGKPQVASQQQHSAGSEEGRGVGPSC